MFTSLHSFDQNRSPRFEKAKQTLSEDRFVVYVNLNLAGMMGKESTTVKNNRILIVESDVGILRILKLMLTEYECISANDGEMAVQLFMKFRPALVLVEIILPKMSGIEATKKILEIDPDAKIIGVTAFRNRWGKDLLEAGAIELIDKPFRKRELLEIVKKHLKNQSIDWVTYYTKET